ncbi:DNA ligase D [Paracoccus sp. CPCC 101403]|uniref:DNA ligase (ATP) n=1 Tax=Paracoccus broussonetiae TaxID=3075834 RepID=A0ABU3EJ47_9RHOB|nr:DNA ligase D [Paracoccus sp. CPCC 101403]MDT1064278.1 DNA ligase D [Paracoccus sp. CPCC 101403]
MALEAYRSKRDFKATSEPKGAKTRKHGHSFVIQKHDATRLHYDFRLEMQGVLKSWAVTRGPSLDPGEKRLAVHVEDHPLDYGDFEGTIPKGQYGGGTVIVWDKGEWKPLGDPEKAYAKGHLEFELQGEKLRGRWHLVRMQHKPGEKRENWLLIKGDDDFARPDGPDILAERPESAKTGRDLAEVARDTPPLKRKPARNSALPESSTTDLTQIKGAKRASMPAFIQPMLATLVTSAPADDRWLHEIKFDGYRLQARIEAGRVKLLTRSGLDWTERFGKPLVEALRDLPVGSAILDTELVVENDSGASDFSALQADLSAGRSDRFRLYVFDLMYLDGFDLQSVPLVDRKDLLRPLLPGTQAILRFSEHFEASGSMVLRHACRLSLEGVVSKLRNSPYRAGRGRSWVKSKCSARQEFVIGGFVPSTTSRKAIGSLILGVYEDGALHHAGRVGTGFSRTVAEDLFARLDQMRQPAPDFDGKLTADETRGAVFVRPDLVAEVEFRAWTADGHLRHASFRGLREDKEAESVMRESPKSAVKPGAAQKRTVALTHPDRLYWPETGVTKEGLADYYAQVWRHIAPFVTGRALALLRCPNGITGEQFFQKHAWKGLNPKIDLVKDPRDKSGQPLISISDLDGMIALVQSATLEIHPWGSTIADWERPDTIIMDLDPGEGVDWPTIVDTAQEVRQRMQDAGLASFVKTSGGKGLHVVAPLKPAADWPAVKAFTKAMAEAMAADAPDRFVATIAKSRRRGKILVDYLRNQRGATAVAAYSTRAREGAPVSAPLAWDELGPDIRPNYFTVENMPTRLAALSSDPWDGFRSEAVVLPGAGRKAKNPG